MHEKPFYIFCVCALTSVGAPISSYATSGEDDAPPPAVLTAINPGFTSGGVANTSDFIEIARVAEEAFELIGVAVRYNSKVIYTFGAGAVFEGDFVLLRYSGSPEVAKADGVYTSNLSMSAGVIELIYGEEVWDAVCWGAEGCYERFDRAATREKTLVRGDEGWAYEAAYEPSWGGLVVYATPGGEEPLPTPSEPTGCSDLRFTEILSYWVEDVSEQFIELHNMGTTEVDLSLCELAYKNKTYLLTGVVAAGGYYVYRGLPLSKDPSKENEVLLRDATGVVATLVYPHGQKKLTSYALLDGVWRLTFAPTPGAENVWQEYRSCETGKVINPTTGNCIKAPVVKVAPVCADDQFLNPETGRCKKIDTGPAPCKEGYERNPETGRCRMIRENNGTTYPPTPESFTDHKVFIGLGAVVTVTVLGGGYCVWQFRREIAGFARRVLRREATTSASR